LPQQEKGKVHIKASELEFGSKIAEGKYGIVYKGKCRGQTVAIKLLHNQHLSEEKLEELKTEVEIMTWGSHIYIWPLSRLFCCCFSEWWLIPPSLPPSLPTKQTP